MNRTELTHEPDGRLAAPLPGVARVDLHVAATSGDAVATASLYQQGFAALGMKADVLRDAAAIDPADDVISIIVGPDETWWQGRTTKRGRAAREWIADKAFILNIEPAGSERFEQVLQFSRHTRGLFDSRQQTVEACRRRGIVAIHVPLGYDASLEHDDQTTDRDKSIDLLVLGGSSPRRERFLAQHRDLFQRYDCALLLVPDNLSPADKARWRTTIARRHALIRASRILVHVNASEDNDQDPDTALYAIANRCLLVTEAGINQPLSKLDDCVEMASIEKLAARCEHFLQHPAEREEFSARARSVAREQLPIRNSCQAILAVARKWPQQEYGNRAWRRATGRDAAIQYARRTMKGITGNQTARWVAYSALNAKRRAVFAMRHRQLLRVMESRRNVLIGRLDKVKGHDVSGRSERTNWPADGTLAPAVSVVVTLYNYSRHIKACLDSVVGSKLVDMPGGIEIIVVDDASTDDSAAIAERYMETCPLAMRVIRNETNSGLACSRNTGLRAAKARHVFILDADNTIYPSCLRKLYREITTSGAAAVYGVIAKFDDKTDEGVGLLSAYDWNVEHLVAGPYIDAMALFDRDKVAIVGDYSLDLIRYGWFGWEDYDLWLKMARAGFQCRFVPEIVAAYRVHEQSMINSTNYYIGSIAKHFRDKFTSLTNSVPIGRSLFGVPTPPRLARCKESDLIGSCDQ